MTTIKANNILQEFKKESVKKNYDITFMDDFPPEVDIDGMIHQYGGRYYILHENKADDFVYGSFYETGAKYTVRIDDEHICFFVKKDYDNQHRFLYFKKLK